MLLALITLILVVGCGGGGKEQAQLPPKPPSDEASVVPVENTADGSTVESTAGAECLKDGPFRLNLQQPAPTDFRAAYQRKALIVVEFFKKGQNDFYPQGLKVDDQVSNYLQDLRGRYPQVEFFDYDIDKPGQAENSEDLGRGEYGTLAAQLKVGYTPFVVMLAPRGDEYVLKNLFQGYVDRGVLAQVPFDLTKVDVRGNSGGAEVNLDRIELTESGGDVEYFMVTNNGNREVNLKGFGLRAVDPQAGEVNRGSTSVQVNQDIQLAPERPHRSEARRTSWTRTGTRLPPPLPAAGRSSSSPGIKRRSSTPAVRLSPPFLFNTSPSLCRKRGPVR